MTTEQTPTSVTTLEKLGTGVDGLREWIVKTWRIATLMAKGAYIVTERKRLFVKLGEQVYYKMSKGEIRNVELEPLVHQLNRLTKKVEIEEILIRGIRFGKRTNRKKKQNEAQEDSGELL